MGPRIFEDKMELACGWGRIWTIHYYRYDAKNEVRLVIEQPKRVIAVEIKLSKSFKPSFTDGLLAIAESSKTPVQQ